MHFDFGWNSPKLVKIYIDFVKIAWFFQKSANWLPRYYYEQTFGFLEKLVKFQGVWVIFSKKFELMHVDACLGAHPSILHETNKSCKFSSRFLEISLIFPTIQKSVRSMTGVQNPPLNFGENRTVKCRFFRNLNPPAGRFLVNIDPGNMDPARAWCWHSGAGLWLSLGMFDDPGLGLRSGLAGHSI